MVNLNQFNVIGWPTLIFINSNQKHLPELKVVGGVIEPEAFIDLLHNKLPIFIQKKILKTMLSTFVAIIRAKFLKRQTP